MSYIRGGIGEDDELIHKRHCERVTKGVIWTSGMGGQVVARDVKIGRESGSKQGDVGHIVKIDGRNIKTNRKVSNDEKDGGDALSFTKHAELCSPPPPPRNRSWKF